MTLGDSDLRPTLDNLAFEFYHLRLYRQLLRRGIENQAYRQATLYALLVHARIIRDFFYAAPKFEDVAFDHFSCHFKEGVETERALDASHAKQMKDQLDKRLAHLTSARWRNGPPPSFDLYEFALDGLEADMRMFENALSPELKHVLDAAMAQRDELYANWIEGDGKR